MTKPTECWQGNIGVYQEQKFDQDEIFVSSMGKKFQEGGEMFDLLAGKKSCLRLKISLNVEQIMIFKVQKRSKCYQGEIFVYN